MASRRLVSYVINVPKYAVLLPREQVESRVIDILKSKKFVPQNKISGANNFFTDYGLDDIHIGSLVKDLEAEFSLKVPDAYVGALVSVNQAVDFFATHPLAR